MHEYDYQCRRRREGESSEWLGFLKALTMREKPQFIFIVFKWAYYDKNK